MLTWTVPSNGSRARIREAEFATQGALAHFDGVVLNAIRETQTGLAQYSAQLQRRDALADAEQSAQLAADQTHRFFQAGRASFWRTCKPPAPTPMHGRNWPRPTPRSP